ncbi:hypothetical protein BJP39_23820 [Streptomyces sp. CC77]|nr:hypothetical protein BJP39_23820 [Streptomyces sp. CC77]
MRVSPRPGPAARGTPRPRSMRGGLARAFLWADVHLSSDPGHHSVGRHRTGPGRIAQDLSGHFSSGRTTLWDAAARAEETLVVRDGELLRYSRRLGETLPGFARRIRTGGEADQRRKAAGPAADAGRAASDRRVLPALADGSVAPDGASGAVYRLRPGPVDGCGLEPLAAQDLVARLA